MKILKILKIFSIISCAFLMIAISYLITLFGEAFVINIVKHNIEDIMLYGLGIIGAAMVGFYLVKIARYILEH